MYIRKYFSIACVVLYTFSAADIFDVLRSFDLIQARFVVVRYSRQIVIERIRIQVTKIMSPQCLKEVTALALKTLIQYHCSACLQSYGPLYPEEKYIHFYSELLLVDFTHILSFSYAAHLINFVQPMEAY